MKKLLELLNSLPADQRDPFARRCGTSFDYLRQIGYGNRLCREALAINIERETSRVVVCEELRPDVDWAYIRKANTEA